MKSIQLDSIVSPWPGYPQAVSAGGFCFLSGILALSGDGELISGWEDLPQPGKSMASGFPNVDALEEPVGAQTWLTYDHIKKILTGTGSGMEEIINVTVFLQDIRDFHTLSRTCEILKQVKGDKSGWVSFQERL